MKYDTENAVRWNPWHGCHKISEGCANCWMYSMDKSRGIDSSIVTRSNKFDFPLETDRQGYWKIPIGTIVLTCFTSDFFIEEADAWRQEAWDIIRQRKDIYFQILTKRPHRIRECLPADWLDESSNGYPNVILSISCENQKRTDERLPILLDIPCHYRIIFCSPMIGPISMNAYLSDKIASVSVGGENYDNCRPLKYDWVYDLYRECVAADVSFNFWDTGTKFVISDKLFLLGDKNTRMEQAWKSGLRYISSKER